jgi:hypothetical protein
MDAPSPGGAPDPVEPTPDGWRAGFDRRMAEIDASLREWGVQWHEPEGRFISALLGAIAQLGELTSAGCGRMEETVRAARAAAQADLEQARELTRHAHASISQARNAQLLLHVERENLVSRMIKETLPLFAERLKEVLVIRERSWNSDVRRRRYAAAGAVVLAIFLGGYALRAWSESDRLAAFDRCLAHAQSAQGHYWCEVTAFQTDIPWAGKQ